MVAFAVLILIHAEEKINDFIILLRRRRFLASINNVTMQNNAKKENKINGPKRSYIYSIFIISKMLYIYNILYPDISLKPNPDSR